MVRTMHIAWLGSIATGLLVVYGAYVACMRMVRPHTIFITGDSYISPDLLAHIRSLLTPEQVWESTSTRLTSEGLFNLIHKKVRSLENIRVRYKSSGCAVVTLMGSAPYMCVNDRLVLTHAGRLVPNTEYAAHALVGLPHIACHDVVAHEHTQHGYAQNEYPQNEFPVEYFTFLKNLPVDFLRNYAVTIHDKTLIKLVCHQQPITLYAWYKTSFSDELCAGIAQVMQRVAVQDNQRPLSEQKSRLGLTKSRLAKPCMWCIDVRMNKKLIVTPVML